MVKLVNGDMFSGDESYKVHQVNCKRCNGCRHCKNNKKRNIPRYMRNINMFVIHKKNKFQ